jgi:hypothetical protein
LSQALLRLVSRADELGHQAVTRLALGVEAAAKEALNLRTHTYGTPTPATPGGPPAKISGDLLRSVTHEVEGSVARIGPADLPHSRYDTRGLRSRGGARAPTSDTGTIGKALEENLGYPWLAPSADKMMAAADVLVLEAFRNLGW